MAPQWTEKNSTDATQLAQQAMFSDADNLSNIETHVSELTMGIVKDVRDWQRNLITIIFAILGVIAPIFYARGSLPPHANSFYFGAGILLIDGIYLADYTKRTLEKDLVSLPIAFNGIKTLIRHHREAAIGVIKDPSEENFMIFVDAGNKIPAAGTRQLTEATLKLRISFTNDIGLGLFVIGLYLLLGGVFTINKAYWLGMSIIIAYFVIRGFFDWLVAKSALRKKLADNKDFERHVDK